jgi:16S rRNA (uracil1498-N3)-methyltransferase
LMPDRCFDETMRLQMDYFYCTPKKIFQDFLEIDGEEFSHLVHVMRKKTGDEIRVVDGLGTAYDVRLEEIKKKTASGKILNAHKNHNEPAISVSLAVGILKNPSKFDFLVEKTTELGIKEIIPLLTERTIPTHAKIDRWQKLALAAMKQSGRSYLPQIQELTSLDVILNNKATFDLKLVAHEKAKSLNPFKQIKKQNTQSVLIIVGPEGGLSEDEFERCLASGYTPLYLGERRLRTETAAIVSAVLTIL